MNIIDDLPPKVDSDTDVSLDIEVFGQTLGRLHRPEGRLASVQVGIDEDVYMIYDVHDLPELFKRIQPARSFIGHNLLYDLRQLRRWVSIPRRFVWDTFIVEHVLWGGYYGNGEFGLDDLVRRYLDIVMDKSTREQFATATEMTPDMKYYAALDANLTLKVKRAQDAEIEKRGDDMRVYREIDEPNLWTVLDFLPIRVNPKRWLEMADDFEKRGAAMEEQLGVNVYSHQQVKEYLHRKLGVKLKDTEATTLEELQSPLADDILLARQYRKASSTYGRNWIGKYVEEGDLVYSDVIISGTETGRHASRNPNLLNIPARKVPEYRTLFIQSRGKLMVGDVQAQEPRCLCYLSGDKALRQAFDEKQDVHLAVARAAFKDDSIVKSDPRREVGKVINLATSYGMSAEGLARRLNLSLQEAERFLNGYFARFSGVRMYIDRQRNVAARRGYVESVAGRRIWMNPYNYQWMNNAINAPIQASAADFTKMWLNKYWESCNAHGLLFPVTMAVYDEIVSDITKEDEVMYKQLLLESAQDTARTLFGDMPFEIDVHAGATWACKREEE